MGVLKSRGKFRNLHMHLRGLRRDKRSPSLYHTIEITSGDKEVQTSTYKISPEDIMK